MLGADRAPMDPADLPTRRQMGLETNVKKIGADDLRRPLLLHFLSNIFFILNILEIENYLSLVCIMLK